MFLKHSWSRLKHYAATDGRVLTAAGISGPRAGDSANDVCVPAAEPSGPRRRRTCQRASIAIGKGICFRGVRNTPPIFTRVDPAFSSPLRFRARAAPPL